MGFQSFALFLAVLYVFLDPGSIILVFLFMPQNIETVRWEIRKFRIGFSTFDLVLLGVLRFSILIGAFLGLAVNNIHARPRLKKYGFLATYFGCFQAIYVMAKILVFTEDHPHHVPLRFWLMIGGTLISSVMFYGCWKLFACYKRPGQYELHVNSSGQDVKKTKDEEEDKDKMNSEDKISAEKQSSWSMIKNLLKMAKPDILYLLLALLALIIASVSQAIMPYYTGLVINYIVIDRSIEKFNRALLYMALITLLAGFASGCRAGLFTFVIGRYTLRLQHKLFTKLTQMEIGFFDVRKTGELTSRLTSDCTKIGDGIGLRFNIFTRSIVRIIGILFFMIKLSWKLSTVTVVAVPIIAIVSNYFGKKYDKVSELVQNALAKANSSAEEVISSMRTVRSFAAEKEEASRYSDMLDNTLNAIKKEVRIAVGYRWSTEMTSFVMTILILYYGGHLVMMNELAGGNLVSFILYSFELTYSIQDIGNVFTGLMEVVGASRKVFFYINRKPLVGNNGHHLPARGIEGDVEFKNISFSYPSREEVPVLNNISFTAKRGEVVALVGPSGGGKSSVINLLQHFYEPSRGEVLIDGVSVKEYDHTFLHQTMSIVQQEPVLFARSIADNIKYGMADSEVSQPAIENAADLANAHSFIADMPEQYKTQTGEKGVQLSGGQKQRVAIARALVRSPTILLLDEATSALDSDSEALVQQAINRNLAGKTVIVIAHRLSTIEKADKILVIRKGEIIEQGSHLDLIECGGSYAELVRKQLLGVSGESLLSKVSKDSSHENRRDSQAETVLTRKASTSSHLSRSLGSSPSIIV